MERVLQRLEGIEGFLLKDPTLRTLAGSSATAPFIGLRAEEIIRTVVNARREQEIDMLYERLHTYERAEQTDSTLLKQMVAQSKGQLARLERTLVAKQDQLDIITRSHREQSDQTQQKHLELESLTRQHNQLKNDHSSLLDQLGELKINYQLLSDQKYSLQGERRELSERIDELSSKLKQQTDRADNLHHTNLQQQSDLYQARSQCDALDRSVRQFNKKYSEVQNSLEQANSRLRKTEFELRSQTEKLFLCKQKEQDLAKQLDQTKESLRTKERQLRENHLSLQEEILRVKQANSRADSFERDKALLEAQLSIEHDKEKNYLAKLEKKDELERLNLELREELMIARSKDKTNSDQIERLSQLYESSRSNLLDELERRRLEFNTLEKVKAELELIVREQSMELNDRNHLLNDFAEGARRSEHKLLTDIQGVKSGANKQLTRKDRKIEELTNEIRVLESKLVELSKRLSDSEERQNIGNREKIALTKSVREGEETHLAIRHTARKRLSKLLTVVEQLRSELRHTRKEHGICVKQLNSLMVKHTDVLSSMLKQHARRKQSEIDELSNMFKSQMEELQRLLNKRTIELKKETEIYRGEIAYRDQLLQKTTVELGSQRKQNLALRETLNSESKLNVIKRLEFEQQLSATKQKQKRVEAARLEDINRLSRRFEEVALASKHSQNTFEQKLDEVTARKSVSFRH